MKNLRENNKNVSFFVILADDLRLIFFSKFTKSVVKDVMKRLKIHEYINENNPDNKELDYYNFKISKCMVENNTNIFIVEIELIDGSILRQALSYAINNENMGMQKFKDNEIKHIHIKNQMESLREKLNMLMVDNYKNNYQKVLEVSRQLDNVIKEYYLFEKGE